VVEQNVHVVIEVADHAFVLENGYTVCSEAAAELGADEERIHASG
jgi:ABC-type branched-subunit amino acid transport system ATPase component